MAIADTLQEIYNNVEKVYEAGKAAGGGDNSAFWDIYQDNGTRTHYVGAFCGYGWTNTTATPKYPITKITSANYMFCYTNIEGDLVEHFKKYGTTLDFSNCQYAHSLFGSATKLTRVGVIDLRKCGAACSSVFSSAGKLETIDELKICDTTPYTIFSANVALKNVKITEGNICTDKWNLGSSKNLSKESITSFINALSPNTSGFNITFSKTAKEAAFTIEEWEALIATKSNWTINLA